jgi:hypothetical protein
MSVESVTLVSGARLVASGGPQAVGSRRDENVDDQVFPTLPAAIERFTKWLEAYGPTSYDHQSYFAGPLGGRAKALYYRKRALGTLAVAPMILSEAFLPAGRRLFGPKQRFPIADAHYAMGFARLSAVTNQSRHYDKAVEFLEALIRSRCPGYEHYCWGYPFDWVTRTGVMAKGTPLITTTPYVYEAFAAVHGIDGQQRWLDIMQSIAEHAFRDIKDRAIAADAATAGYNPLDLQGGVVNASAYRAFLLTDASIRFGRTDYREAAQRNLNFVVRCQQPDGSWFYAADGARDFVDHFHTCFVLKALAKIEKIAPNAIYTRAIDAGLDYYARELFDEHGLPKPFARAPRLTVYRRELYDCAECINLAVLLRGRLALMDRRLTSTVAEILDNWQQADGSFRARRLILGWDNVPMHRWAQSQMFRSLCHVLPKGTGRTEAHA